MLCYRSFVCLKSLNTKIVKYFEIWLLVTGREHHQAFLNKYYFCIGYDQILCWNDKDDIKNNPKKLELFFYKLFFLPFCFEATTIIAFINRDKSIGELFFCPFFYNLIFLIVQSQTFDSFIICSQI